MKTLAILGIIAGVFMIGGIFLTSAGVFDSNQDTETQETTQSNTGCTAESCPYANQGGCNSENNCGLSGCESTSGGSCGCRG